MKKIYFLPLVISMLLVGCFDPEVRHIEDLDAQKAVNSIIYKKDTKTGICYGVLETSRWSSNLTKARSLIITYVPCNEIPEFKTEKDKISDSISSAVDSLLSK